MDFPLDDFDDATGTRRPGARTVLAEIPDVRQNKENGTVRLFALGGRGKRWPLTWQLAAELATAFEIGCS